MKKFLIAVTFAVVGAGSAYAQVAINVSPQLGLIAQPSLALNNNASPATAIGVGILGGAGTAVAATGATTQTSTAVPIGILTQALTVTQTQ